MRVVMGSRSTPPAAPASSGQPPRMLNIKKESPDDEIKEYAETAMNELLGWYGYDKLDSRDTQGLNLHHFAQRSPSDLDSSDAECSSPGRRDAGTGSSQGSPPLPDPSCAWCQKQCQSQQLFSLRTPTGQKAFCSEVCFTQCRRANFKRNKTCDWCRHVRHTVNYVDFQDGEHQLQFCSDKCLNQYKMNIFCKETQAHLQMHPHLQEGGGVGGSASGSLITPELWLRDCRSDSPVSERSVSPPPATSASTPVPTAAPRAASTPPPSLPEPTPALKESIKLRRLSRPKRSHRVPPPATVTSSAPAPADLRTTSSSSPRSAGSISPPKHNHLPPHLHPPPILHPPPHLLPPHDHHLPRHPPPPFLPHHGMLPPPHLFPDAHPRFPILRPPPQSPCSPPPLLPLPPRPPRPLPPPPPPRLLLPPVTVMVPYPIVLPIPIPIPIPIPLFAPFISKVDTPAPSETVTVPPPVPVPSPPPPTPTSDTKPAPRPLRKRKRLGEGAADEEAVNKRKSVPV